MCQKGSSSQATKAQGRKPPADAPTKQQPVTTGYKATSQKHHGPAKATLALIQAKPASHAINN